MSVIQTKKRVGFMVENYYLTEKYLFENNLLSVIAARCTT
jgi:hypothetical protein